MAIPSLFNLSLQKVLKNPIRKDQIHIFTDFLSPLIIEKIRKVFGKKFFSTTKLDDPKTLFEKAISEISYSSDDIEKQKLEQAEKIREIINRCSSILCSFLNLLPYDKNVALIPDASYVQDFFDSCKSRVKDLWNKVFNENILFAMQLLRPSSKSVIFSQFPKVIVQGLILSKHIYDENMQNEFFFLVFSNGYTRPSRILLSLPFPPSELINFLYNTMARQRFKIMRLILERLNNLLQTPEEKNHLLGKILFYATRINSINVMQWIFDYAKSKGLQIPATGSFSLGNALIPAARWNSIAAIELIFSQSNSAQIPLMGDFSLESALIAAIYTHSVDAFQCVLTHPNAQESPDEDVDIL